MNHPKLFNALSEIAQLGKLYPETVPYLEPIIKSLVKRETGHEIEYIFGQLMIIDEVGIWYNSIDHSTHIISKQDVKEIAATLAGKGM